MTGKPGIANGNEQINRRTISYGISVVVTVAAVIMAIVWLGARRGECVDVDTLICSRKDRRLLVFLPSAALALGTVGAFLRASPRWHRMQRLCIRPHLGWILAGLTLAYGVASFSFLF